MSETEHSHEAEPRGATSWYRKAADVLKDAVPVERYAGDLTELRPSGRSLRGKCPAHGGDNPGAFAVYPEDGSWYCYRCASGGDVIHLYQAVENAEFLWALVGLASRYGVELPRRPPSWYRKQERQRSARERMEREDVARARRRLMRWRFLPILQGIEDAEERAVETRIAWAACGPIAGALVGRIRDEARKAQIERETCLAERESATRREAIEREVAGGGPR